MGLNALSAIKTKTVNRSLSSKGFQEDKVDHKFYIFFYNGEKTGIRTKTSHGSKDIGEQIIGVMSKQTRLSKTEFLDLVNCPLSKNDYIELLIKRNYLKKI